MLVAAWLEYHFGVSAERIPLEELVVKVGNIMWDD